jgi:hypothetical protein
MSKYKVVRLETEEKSNVFIGSESGELCYSPNKVKNQNNQKLYIVSNGEIELGDLVIVNEKFIVKANKVISRYYPHNEGLGYHSDKGGGYLFYEGAKKLIATTDTDLDLPLIPKEFIIDICNSGEIKITPHKTLKTKKL